MRAGHTVPFHDHTEGGIRGASIAKHMPKSS
jgi:hypothetical protein